MCSSSNSPNTLDTRGWALLHYAAAWNSVTTARSLLADKRTDVNIQNIPEGQTPLDIAEDEHYPAIISLLLDANAKKRTKVTIEKKPETTIQWYEVSELTMCCLQ